MLYRFSTVVITLIIVSLLFAGCTNVYEPEDLGAPSPGNSGQLTVTGTDTTSLTLNWAAASDEMTPAAEIEYKVVQSLSDDIAGVNSAEANGTTVLDWSADTTTATAAGLTPGTTYYFTVLVRDADGNVTTYVMTSAVTHSRQITKIFWSDHSMEEIYSANTDGSGIDTLVNVSNYYTSGLVSLVFFDPGQMLYVADQGLDAVFRLSPFGTQLQDISTNLPAREARAIGIDPLFERLYYFETSSAWFVRSNPDGSADDRYHPYHEGTVLEMAIDEVNRRMYYTDAGDSTIKGVNLDRTGLSVIVSNAATDVVLPRGIDVDSENGIIYFTDLASNTLFRVNTDGTNLEPLFTAEPYADTPTHIAVDTETQQIYWTNQLGETIIRSNSDGSSPEIIVDRTADNETHRFYGITLGRVIQ